MPEAVLTEAEQLAADRILIANVLSLAPGADGELISLLGRIGRPILGRIVASHDVEPVLSELSAHVWNRNWAVLRGWKQDVPLTRYLAMVARHFAIDSMRARSDTDDGPIVDDDLAEPHWTADPERVRQVHDASQCLERATQQLSGVHQEVIRLRHRDELGHQEIADRLGKTAGYVGPTLARAEKALQAALLARCRELVESLIGVRGTAHG